MNRQDAKDWKNNHVTIEFYRKLKSTHQEMLEGLAAGLTKMNDKELGKQAGWLECLATIGLLIETAEESLPTVEDTPVAEEPVGFTFDSHRARRGG